MLRHFAINDPLKIFSAALIMLILRLPFFIFGDAQPDNLLFLNLLGEKIALGNWMYSDIYTSVEPFAGLYYGLMNFFFGGSVWSYYIFGYLNAVILVILFNNMLLESNANVNKTYVPALVFSVLVSIEPDLYAHTPLMIATTFILLILTYMFKHLEFRTKKDEKILMMGVLSGLSYLLFQPSIYLFLTVLLILILFSNTLLRRYFLMLFGVLLIGFFFLLTYYFRGELASVMVYFTSWQWSNAEFAFIWNTEIYFLSALFLLSVFVISGKAHFSNHQSLLSQAMFIWLLAGVAIYLFYNSSSSALLLLIVPISFYASHLFTVLEDGRFRKVLFFLFMTFAFAINFLTYVPGNWIGAEINKEKEELRYESVIRAKRILVLGEGYGYYQHASHSGPFLEFDLIDDLFRSEPDYERLVKIEKGISMEYPQVIIDQEGLLQKYIKYLPELSNRYRREGDLWLLIEP